MTSLVMRPFVEGDQALGYAITGNTCGSMTCAEKLFSDQPRPNGPHDSSLAFCIPHLSIVSRVHSLARFILGELVKRPPMTSVRYESVCITSERFSPSSRILSMTAFGAV